MLRAASELQVVRERVALTLKHGQTMHRLGGDALNSVREYTALIDDILTVQASRFLDPIEDAVSVLAVGGYGRQELCPYSDIDLLFLVRKGQTVEGVKRLVRLLWDAGFELGHSVRTPEECFLWMRDDLSTATALFDARFLCGQRSLYEQFLSGALARYSKRRGAAFVAAQLRLLRESLEDPKRTIYVIEPDIKEGVCGLRDVQRIRWIEKLSGRDGDFPGLLRHGDFPTEGVEVLRRSYAFSIGLRCELHYVNKMQLDILERDSQGAVACNLGYGDATNQRAAVEALMGDYYRHARGAYRFLRYFVETESKGRRFFGKLARTFLAEKLPPFLTFFRGRFYLSDEAPETGSPEEIVEVFRLAQEKNARLSESLCESVRQWIEFHGKGFTDSAMVMRMFLAILRDGRSVGRLLKTMHETGVLSRIIPEFSKLDCLVSLDGHHHFTVDEHTLKTLRELDRLVEDDDYPTPEFRDVFDQIDDPLPLRLALLLHDIGKGFHGDHSVSGTSLALVILSRLGLDERVAHTVEFLIYRHLELFKLSERRDINEPDVIESLASLVRTEQRLKMLYLLTYIDITSVGPGVWTRWKGAQLAELYQRTLIRLRTGQVSEENLEAKLLASEIGAAERSVILSHCRELNSPEYNRETVPERMLFHANLAKKVDAKDPLVVAAESFGDYHEIIFCGLSRPRLFADLTGLLFSEGFNVLAARISSRSDGIVLGQFYVEIADAVRIGMEQRVERMQEKIRSIASKAIVLSDVVSQRRRDYRESGASKALYGPKVVVNNLSSERYTIVEVNAADRPGLLFDLATTLHHLGLQLERARVSTFGERVRDAFYVLEVDGEKVENPARQLEIELSLSKRARRPGRLMREGTWK